VESSSVPPAEDEAQSRAKAQMELQKAQQQSREQLRRFESELQVKPAPESLQPPKLQ